MNTPSFRKLSMGAGSMVGILFLLIQVVFIVRAQFHSTRWFCWAPNDYMTDYQLYVFLGSRPIPPAEITQRYHIADRGIEENRAEHIIAIIRQYEETYGRDNPARVILSYSVNGGKQEQWIWPPQ